jgi:hypothetical protein
VRTWANMLAMTGGQVVAAGSRSRTAHRRARAPRGAHDHLVDRAEFARDGLDRRLRGPHAARRREPRRARPLALRPPPRPGTTSCPGAHRAIRPWVRWSPSARPSRRPSEREQLVAQAHVDRSADLGAAGPAFRLARSPFFIVFAARFKISRRYAVGTQLVVVVARSCLKLSELTCDVSASRHSLSQQTR